MRCFPGTVVTLILCGCAALKPQPDVVSPAQVTGEIARWEETSRHANRATEAYRRLFVLYTMPALTVPDYDRSAAALASYLALDPSASKDIEVRRWQAVLSALREARAGARKEREENGALRSEVRELRRNLADARKESQDLKETLEKLKALDLQMDQQRRGR